MKKRNLIFFIIIMIISCVAFKDFLNMHYATDTYNIIDRGYKEYAILYSLNDGRVLMSGISMLADKLNMPINVYVIGLTFLAIAVLCVTVVYIYNVIIKQKTPKNIWEKILVGVMCYCTIFNFMFLENMQFAECFVMAVSILLYTIAAYLFVNKEHTKFLSAVLVIIGIFCYQGTLRFFYCRDSFIFYNKG